MCGITGYWDFGADVNAVQMRGVITAMTNSMYLRGPDSGGAWIEPGSGLALGHRRLAVRDLTLTGHQPMTDSSGQFVIVYNGEVYNADELRRELAERYAVRFRGTSDTEVILHGCAVWGVAATVQRLIGMFAFAFWSRKDRTLTLVRDRLGIKPLYWGMFDRLFLFGSELKALCRHPGWEKRIDRDAVSELMRYCYIPAPLSIYEGIRKLRPGHMLEVGSGGQVKDTCYWDARAIAADGTRKRSQGDERELADDLERLLRDSVKRRMISDVPIGAFLSGGIDSSLVAALMQSQSSAPVKTFSIGFEEAEYNEAPYAKAVAAHLGTEHTEEYMTPRQAWEIIPRMAAFYDEPFADSSQLPTYLLAAITRKHVTVSLSGDGGDELFAGYSRYFNFLEKFPEGECPAWKKFFAGRVAPLLSPGVWDRVARLLPRRIRPAQFGSRLYGFADRSALSSSALYRQIGLAHWPRPLDLALGAKAVPSIFDDRSLARDIPDMTERMQFLDSVHYLPDDILVKVDRATMAVSLEARVPLIDHRIYEFTWKLPSAMRVRNGQGKWILRQILGRYVPLELVDRPKMGFGVPIDHWLRGPLRNWAEDLLGPARLRQEGFLNPALVSEVWNKHLTREADYHYWLWDVLMFQSWLGSKDRTPDFPGGADPKISIEVAT